MLTLSYILTVLIPTASAAALQNAGSGNPAVAEMWIRICSVLPFCALDAATAPGYFSSRIILVVQSLIAPVAIIMILYASVLLSTTQVDEGRKDEAKRIILYACIGLVLAVISGALLQYLLVTVFPQLFQ